MASGLFGPDGDLRFASAGFPPAWSDTGEKRQARNVWDVFAGEGVDAESGVPLATRIARGDLIGERRYAPPGRTLLWTTVEAALLDTWGDGPADIIVRVFDVTAERWRRARQAHIAGHDRVTGAPTAAALARALVRAQAAVFDPVRPGALLLIDVEPLVAAYPHPAHGLLRTVAGVLQEAATGGVFLARAGEAQFAAVVPDATEAEAMAEAQALRWAIDRRLRGHGRATATVGMWLLRPALGDLAAAGRRASNRTGARDVAVLDPDAGATLGVGAAAARLGISRSTLRRLIEAGHVVATRTPGGHRRLRVVDVERERRRLHPGPLVRAARGPQQPIPVLGAVLRDRVGEIRDVALRSVYVGPDRGWLGTRAGSDAIERWLWVAGDALASGDVERAVWATGDLLDLAAAASVPLLERVSLLDGVVQATRTVVDGEHIPPAELQDWLRFGRVLRQVAFRSSDDLA